VLDLNPHHFGAASGQGMCFMGLQDYKGALRAFERALAIHPGLAHVQHLVEALRSGAANVQRADADEDGEQQA
jgi:hypothetical protein